MNDERPKKSLAESGELKATIFKGFAASFKRCLAPGTICRSKDVIKAHGIQNGRILAALQERGHVIMPKVRLTIDPNKPPSVPEFKEIGRNEATTFTGLCKKHDNDLLAPIDDCELDPNDARQKFLLAYRSVLRETHVSMRSARWLQGSYGRSVELGLSDPENYDQFMAVATESLINSWRTYRYKVQYDTAYIAEDYDSIRHDVVRSPESPCPVVAASTTFFVARKGNDEVGITLNLFPHDGRHLLIVSYRSQHMSFGQKVSAPLLMSRGRQRLERVSRRILSDCENFVLNPSSWSSLSEAQKTAIRNYFFRTTLDRGLEVDDPRLNLFEAVP